MKSKTKKDNLFARVYRVVKRIPKGKVMTYGQIAKILCMRDARKVGWALHGNKDPEIFCHRVVNKDGKVAVNYSMGNWREQKARLLEEGVGFRDEMHVDLDKFLWRI